MSMQTTRSIAITSGKGGVGKSCIALNIAILLARRNKSTLLVDGDLGLGNIGLMIGASPEETFENVLTGECSVKAACLEGPEGLAILPAASGRTREYNGPLNRNLTKLTELERSCEIVIVDTGAGIPSTTVDLASAADQTVLVVTPEPTAIADAYATLKLLLGINPRLQAKLLVNMVDTANEAEELHERFRELVEQFLGAKIGNWGYIPLDRYVRESVKRQTPFVLASPPSSAAEALQQVVEDLLRDSRNAKDRKQGLFERAVKRDNSPHKSPPQRK